MKKLILAGFLMSVSSLSFSADLSKTCSDYYTEIDKYIDSLSSNDAMKAQAEAIKAQYEESKKQIAAMPSDVQEQACKAALNALKQAQQMMPKS
ncbi:hypothetical protein CYG68_19400 [Morganella morganii]|uniref:TonB-dependent receptor n=1 Tax=Morganella morganii TaxID=582 RepID=A0A8I0Q425_MORMO|nr:DUF5339 domain-containing protein [Morganella morganii]MBE8614525.1 hypothetical protein [Morganella morganii]